MEHAPWPENPMELSYDQSIVSDVLEHLVADDFIERPVLRRQVVKIALFKLQAGRIGLAKSDQKVPRLGNLLRVDIQGDYVRPGAVGKPGEVSVAASRIQHVAISGFPEPGQQRPIASVQIESRIEQVPEEVQQSAVTNSVEVLPGMMRSGLVTRQVWMLGHNATRMTILFGHPTGNPNSHHTALAHLEGGWLEAFCVPWMPTTLELAVLEAIPGLGPRVARLRRRHFAPLDRAEKVQGRMGEWGRMCKRLIGGSWADERLSYEGNDWLMNVMRDECRRSPVTAVHSYEDCSLLQFRQAARDGKARIYDLPIGYYPAWESTSKMLASKFQDWLPGGYRGDSPFVRPAQKREEMELADLVLAPSTFVQRTVQRYVDRKVTIVPYGVDTEFWCPRQESRRDGPMRFLFAGQCSLRKGTPLLLKAWSKAALDDAELDLVGAWRLADARLRELPAGVQYRSPVSAERLRDYFRSADVLVLPSYFEGLALVILEAMACGLPVIASDATGGADIVDSKSGCIAPAGDLDAWVELLCSANTERQRWKDMRLGARRRAETMTWNRYREGVRGAARAFAMRH